MALGIETLFACTEADFKNMPRLVQEGPGGVCGISRAEKDLKKQQKRPLLRIVPAMADFVNSYPPPDSPGIFRGFKAQAQLT